MIPDTSVQPFFKNRVASALCLGDVGEKVGRVKGAGRLMGDPPARHGICIVLHHAGCLHCAVHNSQHQVIG